MPLLGEKDHVSNPVQKYVEWKGSTAKGYFCYRDKEKSLETEYNIDSFIVVAIGYKVGGYSKKKKSGIYSNEIDSIVKDKLIVKFSDKGEEIAAGKYSDIKEKIKADNGRLMIVITALTNDELIQIKLKGEAFFNFSSLLKHIDRNKTSIKFAGKHLVKGELSDYYLPQFEAGEDFVGTPDGSKAMEYAAQVKEYRDFNQNRYDENIKFVEEEQDEVDKILHSDDVDDDLPF